MLHEFFLAACFKKILSFICAKKSFCLTESGRERERKKEKGFFYLLFHEKKAEEGEEDKEAVVGGEDVEELEDEYEGSGSGDFESLTRDGGEIDLPTEQAAGEQTEGVS